MTNSKCIIINQNFIDKKKKNDSNRTIVYKNSENKILQGLPRPSHYETTAQIILMANKQRPFENEKN